MPISEKVQQLADGFAGLSAEERREFVSLVAGDEVMPPALGVESPPADTTTDERFRRSMDKVFGHHAPLLKKLAR